MWVINQNRTETFQADKMKHFAIVEGNGYAMIMGRIDDHLETGVKFGKYENARDAKYVLERLFDALNHGKGFEFPGRYDIPDLNVYSGKGTFTSRKTNHGHS